MTERILIVEDDPLIGPSLKRALAAVGMHPMHAVDGASALAAAARHPPDLVLLDLGLPDLDGEFVARRLLASRPDMPVIMLTARSEEADIVAGLHLGAVDYVTKPFGLAELLARIRAQLRATAPRRASVLTAGDVRIDLGSHRAWVGGLELGLRPREFDLLVCLARTPGRLLTRSRLVAEVWGADWVGSPKNLDVHVGALRRQLGERTGQPSRLVAVRGRGYRFEPR